MLFAKVLLFKCPFINLKSFMLAITPATVIRKTCITVIMLFPNCAAPERGGALKRKNRETGVRDRRIMEAMA